VCAAGALALCVALGGVPASADDNSIKTVLVIAMENHREADVFRGFKTESAGMAIAADLCAFFWPKKGPKERPPSPGWNAGSEPRRRRRR